ncbi:metalloregulator ArsR/SmtB family transcription factor [Roseomonas sp. E05]|uniref:ArsR/SmtB family transcription factor n=1 Tax=Roseomonas sp. E05 TaxID=3046310 RepID=UPI0024BB784B|nr:metalloregulator ArsR/SmtB family transcription factor [Roseomonas sp. E05]MDJ0391028.1 metalloregulator ArsR/SmtB family transcription factor [Roseomonas sp. E05]
MSPDAEGGPTALAESDASHVLTEDAQRAADFLKTLANPWRLRILCALAEGPLAVGVLAARIGAREGLVSQHLMRLRAEGLVRGERNGHNVTYSLTSGPAAEVIAVLHRAFCAR